MNKKYRRILFIVLIVVAAFLRIYAYRGSLWLDEFTTIDIVEKGFDCMIRSLDRTHAAPPLTYLTLHLFPGAVLYAGCKEFNKAETSSH